MSANPLDWKSPEPGAPLPYGWTDADVATLYQLAHEIGVNPLEVLALLYSESGLNPHASSEGLAGLTSVVETEMGWPHGTIQQLNAGPITTYLQAVFQFWAHIAEKYIHGTYPGKAKSLGITPGAALYVFHGFLGPALGASGPNTVLGKKPPVWPVTWQNGNWSYQGKPVAAELGRPLTGAEVLYSGNPGLDIGQKGTITIADMQTRVNRKAADLQKDPVASRIYQKLATFDDLPTGTVPTLASLFGAVRGAWQALTHTDIRTTVDAVESPHGAGDTPPETTTPAGDSPSAAGASGAGLLLIAGVVAAAYFALRRK